MDMVEYKLNMYRSNPKSENLEKAIQIFKYLQNDVLLFRREDHIKETSYIVLAYLANIDGIVTKSEISFLTDFMTLARDRFKTGISPEAYLKSFKNDENEETLLRFAGDHESVKDDLQILGMIMYTYDGSMPSKKKIEFLKKLEC